MSKFKLFPAELLNTMVLLLLLPLPFSSPARADEISDSEVQQYAQAVLEIESHRQQALEDITRIIGESPPEIICNRPDTYRSLPDDAKDIATNYCQTSESIVKNTGLSVTDFNRITQQLQEDSALERRIQEAIGELR